MSLFCVPCRTFMKLDKRVKVVRVDNNNQPYQIGYYVQYLCPVCGTQTANEGLQVSCETDPDFKYLIQDADYTENRHDPS